MICITGRTSDLKCTLFPPLDLSDYPEWEMGFYDLATYNSIPNVEENKNNNLYFSNNVSVTLPTGSYEIGDINKSIINELKRQKSSIKFNLTANNNTLKSEIYCNSEVDFTKPHTHATLLGFNEGDKLTPNETHISPNQVNIIKVDVIRITCNIVRGSYRDGVEGHVLHEFYPNVSPGFKIVEKPKTVKYLSINKHNSLSEFYIRLEDQNGDLVNFRGESINLRVDIRPAKTATLLRTLTEVYKNQKSQVDSSNRPERRCD